MTETSSIESMIIFVGILVALYGMGVYRDKNHKESEEEANSYLTTDEGIQKVSGLLTKFGDKPEPITVSISQGGYSETYTLHSPKPIEPR